LRGSVFYRPTLIECVEIWDDSIENFIQPPIKSMAIQVKENVLHIDSKRNLLPHLHSQSILKEISSQDGYPATQDGNHWLLFSETGLFHKIQVRVT
jgi:hypothetical protein